MRNKRKIRTAETSGSENLKRKNKKREMKRKLLMIRMKVTRLWKKKENEEVNQRDE